MHNVSLAAEDDFDGWRSAARRLAEAGVPAAEVSWSVGGGGLFGGEDALGPAPTASGFSVSKRFIELADSAVRHRDPERFALLYTVLADMRAGRRSIADAADPLVRRVEAMAKAVRRDMHKMRAFVRFRELGEGEAARYVAWFEPEHHIVRANAPFFARRFASMRWSILTPEVSAHWDGETLAFGPGAARSDAPGGDPVEEVWKTYYASTFNPARVKVKAMTAEMPKKYWRNMPETALVPGLIAGAQAREAGMVAASERQVGGNAAAAWEALRTEAAGCTRCDLYRCATQTVFGEGPLDARLMFVGEQPGDQEDIAGRPFVGPAGKVFDRALAAAGIERAATYVTNAVKHFKYEQRGKRRIHAKPDIGEIDACRWWIEHERGLVRPRVIVALGATAVRSVLGRTATITSLRGKPIALETGEAWVTVHPSFLLRIDDKARAEEEYARFVEDLRGAAARAD